MRVPWLTATALFVAVMLATAQSPGVDDVVARLDAYLAEYEPRLSELIADEVMLQEIRRSPATMTGRQEGASFGSLQRRRLQSEVAFVGLPDNAGWLGFRHVKQVDNRPVKDSGASLKSALSTQGYAAARRLLMESAQHNLGLARTTNLPNLPLEFLHRRNRKRLVPSLDGTERVRDLDAAKLLFDERARPTLIGNPNGNDMPCIIQAWVDLKTGGLLRAEVRMFESGATREHSSTVRVEFERDPKLEMLVPVEMRESFTLPPPANGTSVATYANFRRFQTSARIVPPPGAR